MKAFGYAILVVSFTATAHAETVAVSAAECKKLVAHTPNDDVNYKPGVDVRGNKVAPADLDGGYQMELPESIDLQIGVDLADRLAIRDANKRNAAQAGAGLPTGGAAATRKVLPAEGYAPLGTLSIRGNEAYWNGKLLAGSDQAALTLACRQGLAAAAKK